MSKLHIEDKGDYILIDETPLWPKQWSRDMGKPDLICVHRTANASATASSNNKFARRTGKASWHECIDDSDGYGKPVVRMLVPSHVHAWHILESRIAAKHGRSVTVPWRNQKRGDYGVYGVEVDEDTGGWNEATRKALVARLRDLFLESRMPAHRFARVLTPEDNLIGHSEFDPWTRSHDPDDLWHPDDIRHAVANAIAQAQPKHDPEPAQQPNNLAMRVTALEALLKHHMSDKHGMQ